MTYKYPKFRFSSGVLELLELKWKEGKKKYGFYNMSKTGLTKKTKVSKNVSRVTLTKKGVRELRKRRS